ncbi:MAG: ABC transporter ATP-binding protein [Candidatus Hydrogenedentota bacterium]
MSVIEVENVCKYYPMRRGPRALLGRGGLSDWFRRRRHGVFAALEDVSFTVEAGESVGIIGANGSGKSTLLKILAGITQPTGGHTTVKGRVASLVELGAGFHPMLTGRENIYLNAGILGMRHAEVDKVFDDIAAFSGISDFLDNPVDTYSSGMYVRLGFSVAIHVNPDIFLVDEVLSVGDQAFQRKCRERIGQLKESGKTIVFVSHDLNIVTTLCERVLLLSQGQLIVRNTPQETVDFYLRQVGGKEGVHIFSRGAMEAVMSHGRLHLYYDGSELTAPTGLHCLLQSMGQRQPGTSAAWEVTEAGPNRCVARGRMPRLPVTVWWTLELEEDALIWKIEAECERPVPLEDIQAHIHLRTAYTHWLYGDLEGAFPELDPGDVTWVNVVAPEMSCRDAAAFPEAESGLPTLHIERSRSQHHLRLAWSNTDYITGCRALVAGVLFPESQRPLGKGRHELVTLRLRVTRDPEGLREEARQRQTVHSGDLAARFTNGVIQLHWKGEPLTTLLHAYTSILAGNLWNDSHNFQWSAAEKDEDGVLSAIGASRRFPFKQYWRMEPMVDRTGVKITIQLEILEQVTFQEYHTSVVLRREYTGWETDHESGAFPEFRPHLHHWVHANRDYTPGRWITALSSEFPSVTLNRRDGAYASRMTPVNTGYRDQARVIQALSVPEHTQMTFEPGMYSFFEGVIVITE